MRAPSTLVLLLVCLPACGGCSDDEITSDPDAAGDDDVDAGPDVDANPNDLACVDQDLGDALGDAIFTGTNAGAGDDLASACGGSLGEELVFTWTAPADGAWLFDTSSSTYDTNLTIRAGSCSGTRIACNDDGPGTTRSRAVVQVVAGATIVIAVDAADAVTSGALVLDVHALPATLVAPPIAPTDILTPYDEVSFLFEGPDAVQHDVDAAAIDPALVAVLRGRVLDEAGAPIFGAEIAAWSDPESGTTWTRADGWYDLAANGGEQVTLTISASGYLPAARTFDLRTNDLTVLDDVVLVALDPHANAIDLSSGALQTARGTVITDDAGTRQATLLFPPGTAATYTDPSGAQVARDRLTVRVTEYTVGDDGPARMPGTLPPYSGYTYAVELSVDEVSAANPRSRVEFSPPVGFYLENYLGFGTGDTVPAGALDADGRWQTEGNGRVIEIVSETAGRADLDLDGDGDGDDATTIGIADTERTALATLYDAGQQLWYVEIAHFTPWDFNSPYGPPPDAEPPVPQPAEETSAAQSCYPNCTEGGSILGIENRTLGEALPITGTPYALRYQSDHVPGAADAYTVDVPLVGAVVPPGLRRVHLEIMVAGTRTKLDFAPAASLSHRVTWDGRDPYGRLLYAPRQMRARIGFEYDAQYFKQQSDFDKSFGRFPGEGNAPQPSFTRVNRPGNKGIIIWQGWESQLGVPDARHVGLGGWMIDVHHRLDPQTRTVYLGNGDRRVGDAIGRRIDTVAQLYNPLDVIARPDGTLLVSTGSQIVSIDDAGVVTVVVGGGTDTSEGAAPLDALIDPGRIAVDERGVLHWVGRSSCIVQRADPAHGVITIAGQRNTCDSVGKGGPGSGMGDGGPATEATLDYLSSLAFAPDGSLIVGETRRLRRIGTDGIIASIAGTASGCGSCPFTDGASSASVDVSWIDDVVVGADGTIYFANSRDIRRIAPDGTLHRLACDPNADPDEGDGGPALEAGCAPSALALGPDGTLYWTDDQPHLRHLRADGIVERIAGRDASNDGFAGIGGGTGDGGHALDASWANDPGGLSLDPAGRIFLTDPSVLEGGGASGGIRMVSPPIEAVGSDERGIASGDGAELWVFDAAGRHLRTLDARDGATIRSFEYSAGRLVGITDRDGDETVIARDGAGVAQTITSPDGFVTTLALDGNGWLDAVTDPAGGVSDLTADANGLLTHLVDAAGGVHVFTYDVDGHLAADEDPAHHAQTLAVASAAGARDITRTSPTGLDTVYGFAYGPDGDLTRTIDTADGLTATIETAPDGTTTSQLTDGTIVTTKTFADPRFGPAVSGTEDRTITTPGGITTHTEASRSAVLDDPFDPLSATYLVETTTTENLTSTWSWTRGTAGASMEESTSPEGRSVTTNLDAFGRAVSSAAYDLMPIVRTFDASGHLTAATQGTHAKAWTWDDGVIATSTELDGTTAYTYDAAGRMLTVTLPDLAVITLTRDVAGRVTAVAPPGKPAWTTTYDDRGFAVTRVAPDAGAGTDTTAYTWDADGRISHVARPDGSSVDWTYDAGGRLSLITDDYGTVQRVYGTDGQVSAVLAPDADVSYVRDGPYVLATGITGPFTASVQYTWDGRGLVTSEQVDGVSTVASAYDDDGLVVAAGPLDVSRDAESGLVIGVAAVDAVETRTLDAYGALTGRTVTVDGLVVFDEQLVLDDGSRVEQLDETSPLGTRSVAFTYDARSRLASADDGVTTAYTYDANGNLAGGTVDARDRLTAEGIHTYTWSDAGALLARDAPGAGRTFDYDASGNLHEVVLEDDTVIGYLVDGLGRRVARTIDGAPDRGYLWGEGQHLVAELDAAGAVRSRFIDIAGGAPELMIRGGITYLLIQDHLGSVRAVVDADTGAVAQNLAYDPWGVVLTDSNPGFQPFGFAGGLADPATGLVHFGRRDYDPSIGRWLTSDPVGLQATMNLYTYAAGDPVNLVDRTGFAPESLGPSTVGISGNSAMAWEFAGIAFDKGSNLTLYDRTDEMNKLRAAEAAITAAFGADAPENIGLSQAILENLSNPPEPDVKVNFSGPHEAGQPGTLDITICSRNGTKKLSFDNGALKSWESQARVAEMVHNAVYDARTTP